MAAISRGQGRLRSNSQLQTNQKHIGLTFHVEPKVVKIYSLRERHYRPGNKARFQCDKYCTPCDYESNQIILVKTIYHYITVLCNHQLVSVTSPIPPPLPHTNAQNCVELTLRYLPVHYSDRSISGELWNGMLPSRRCNSRFCPSVAQPDLF